MSLLNLLGVGTAFADSPVAATAAQPHQSPWSMFLFPLLIIVFLYFIMIRPQSKRAKEQRAMLDKITIGDEVLTIGGAVAQVVRLQDSFVVLRIAKDVEVKFQRTSIASVLPKGTVEF